MEFWEEMGWHYEIFPIPDANTTAENMSKFLAKHFYEMLNSINRSVMYVTMHIWETEGSEAQYTYKGENNG